MLLYLSVQMLFSFLSIFCFLFFLVNFHTADTILIYSHFCTNFTFFAWSTELLMIQFKSAVCQKAFFLFKCYKLKHFLFYTQSSYQLFPECGDIIIIIIIISQTCLRWNELSLWISLCSFTLYAQTRLRASLQIVETCFYIIEHAEVLKEQPKERRKLEHFECQVFILSFCDQQWAELFWFYTTNLKKWWK